MILLEMSQNVTKCEVKYKSIQLNFVLLQEKWRVLNRIIEQDVS